MCNYYVVYSSILLCIFFIDVNLAKTDWLNSRHLSDQDEMAPLKESGLHVLNSNSPIFYVIIVYGHV